MNAPVSLCPQFEANIVKFFLGTAPQNPDNQAANKERSAFMVLMSRELIRPDLIQNPKNNFDRMYNKLLELLREQKLGWQRSMLPTAQRFVKCLVSLLWHITCHHTFFKERAASIPEIFGKFSDMNDYAKKKKAKPQLQSKSLNESIEELSTYLVQPWFHRKVFENFARLVFN